MYLDDIVIFSGAPDKRIGHVCKVLTLLCNVGVTLKLKKRKVLIETIDFLGYVIRPRHLGISSHTTDAKHGLKAPTKPAKL